MKDKFIIRWLPVFLWAIIIFITSANPNPYRALPASWNIQTLPIQSDPGSKKITRDEILGRFLHAAEYLVLAACITRALVGRGDLRIGLLIMALGLSALYALSDEVHQLYVPGRAFELGDLALDLAGSALGIISFATFLILQRRRTR
jgi:VanZ family protein